MNGCSGAEIIRQRANEIRLALTYPFSQHQRVVLLGNFAAYSSVRFAVGQSLRDAFFYFIQQGSSRDHLLSEKCVKSINSAWNALRKSDDGVSALFHSLKIRSVFTFEATACRPVRDNHHFFLLGHTRVYIEFSSFHPLH